VQRFLYETARLTLREIKHSGMWGMHDWPLWLQTVRDDEARLPRVPSADDIYVVVAGGPGKHSCVVPNCCFSKAVTRTIAGV
jgi:hypothetical protein